MSVAVTFLTQLDFANYGKLALGLGIGRAIAGRSRGYRERILATPVVFSLVLSRCRSLSGKRGEPVYALARDVY